MPEVTEVQPQKVAGFVDTSARRKRREEKLKKEEEELEALLKGQVEEESQEEEKEEVEAKEEETQEEVKEEKEEDDKELSAEEKTFKKRYGDLRRHMAEKEKEWKKKFETLEARMETSSIVPPKSDEDILEWQKKYPDVAAIVQRLAEKIADEKFSEADERLKKLDELASETTRKTAEQKIAEAHSDFYKLRDSDDFHDWAGEQPKWVQDALYENQDDPGSVIRVIDLYKVDKGLTTQAKKKKEKDAAASVSTKSKPSVDAEEGGSKIRESDVARMSDKEYEEREEEILTAMKTGKFIYDISGGAR